MIVSTFVLLLASDFPTYADLDRPPGPPDAPTIVMGILSAVALIGAMVAVVVLTLRHNREQKRNDKTRPPVRQLTNER